MNGVQDHLHVHEFIDKEKNDILVHFIIGDQLELFYHISEFLLLLWKYTEVSAWKRDKRQ